MQHDKVVLPKLRCPHCGYTWIPRVAKPRECPRCKRILTEVKVE